MHFNDYRCCNYFIDCYCCSVTKLCPTLRFYGLQHARLPCPSLSLGVCSNSCPLSWTILCFVATFTSCPQSFPASESFQMRWLFTQGGQSSGASASACVLPVNYSADSIVPNPKETPMNLVPGIRNEPGHLEQIWSSSRCCPLDRARCWEQADPAVPVKEIHPHWESPSYSFLSQSHTDMRWIQTIGLAMERPCNFCRWWREQQLKSSSSTWSTWEQGVAQILLGFLHSILSIICTW